MKRVFTFIFCIILCVSFTISASATEVTNLTLTSTDDSEISPYPFLRKYKDYYTEDSVITIVEDPNYDFFIDTNVVVSFVQSEGPGKIFVELFYKNNDQGSWISAGYRILSLNGSTSWNIPENSCFKVTGILVEGNEGYATFQVSLD